MLAPLLHAYVYGAVPPDTVVLMAPVEPPLQLMWVTVPVTVGLPGWARVAVTVLVQPNESVTVTVYVPAERLEIS